jgi:hypothetical protein
MGPDLSDVKEGKMEAIGFARDIMSLNPNRRD